MFEVLVDNFFPPRCKICRTGTKDPFCADCDPRNCRIEHTSACPLCREESEGVCIYCEASEEGAMRSLWHFEGAARDAIHAWKYQGNFQLSKYFADCLLHSIEQGIFEKSDWNLIVPMPSSPGAVRQRGFSQTALLAKKLANSLSLPWRQVLNKQSGRQVELEKSARFESMKGNIRLNTDVSNKRILLVDDVLTTGASVEAARAALVEAERVDVLTLCRSRQFSKNRMLKLISELKQCA